MRRQFFLSLRSSSRPFQYSRTNYGSRPWHQPTRMASMKVTFLGTSSGGGPSKSRNCSSLVASVLADGSLWMVDCAEGTLRQILMQPYRDDAPRISRLSKIFITHMHADHVMGIVTVLRNILFPPSSTHATLDHPRIEIYGPAGIRKFIRTILTMTLTATGDKYIVHELLRHGDEVTSCDSSELHSSEFPGRDIFPDADGFWRGVTHDRGLAGEVFMDAGPIKHRDPCIGYVIRESKLPHRKIVILGDTYDPSDIIPLCQNPSPSLLIHEATDAHIPESIDPKAKRTRETILSKAMDRGHSLPEMAGSFAKQIGAERLVLNHIGARFPDPAASSGSRYLDGMRRNVIHEIERQATEAWGMGRARVAWDYMNVIIPKSNETSTSDSSYLGSRPPPAAPSAWRKGISSADPSETERSESDGKKRKTR